MKLFMFAVFDSCSGVYDRPMVARSEGEMLRSFKDIACDADHPVGQHPEHFSLFRIGMYDDSCAVVVPEVACCIGKAHELIAVDRVIEPGGLKGVV